jgi:ATP-dependent Clp protease protease subunit
MAGNGEHKKNLADYGIVFISSVIDSGTARSVCEEIIRINVEKEAEFVQMIINSPGGDCAAGFAIIDMMEWSTLPVYTTGVGLIASMGLAVFMAGEKGRRVLTPRTSVLSHRFSAFSWGNHSELVARRKEEDFMHRRLIDHYCEHTKLKTIDEIQGKLLRDVDTWLTPEEALDLGIADIIQPDGKKSGR